jgi:outer membrane receptor protein involved in Fe transport
MKIKFGRLMILSLAFLLMLIHTASAFSQAVTGTVTDAETHKPLSDVNITIKGTPIGTNSQANGDFNLAGLPPGEYTLEASMMGYKILQMPFTLSSESLPHINIRLVPTVLQLKPIEVTAQRYRDVVASPKSESPALYTSISVIKRHEIQKQGAKTLIESMQYIPGALVETRGRKVKQFFSMRGQTYPYPEYALNGSWQREFHELPYFFSSADIEKIEIVRSSAALLTGLTGLAGVIKVETRRYEHAETSFSGEYGTFDSYRARLSHGSKIGDLSYATGLGIQGTQGPDQKNAAERMANFYGRLDWQPSAEINIDFNLFHLNGKRELALAESPANNTLQTTISRYDPYKSTLANLKAFYQPNQKISSELLLYYTKRDPVYVTESDPSPISTSERDYEFGLNFTQAISPFMNNTLRFGGLYNHWVAPNGKRFYVGRRSDLETFSAVIVDEHRLGNFNLDGGLRWSKTHINKYGAFNINGVAGAFRAAEPIVDTWEPGIVNASLGAVYHFDNPYSIHLNLAAGQIKPREGSLSDTFKKPENETRLKMDLGFQMIIDNIGKISLSGFYIAQKNAIVLSDTIHIADGRILEYYLNRDQDQAGLEIEARSPLWFNRLEFFINMLSLYSRFEEDGGKKTNSQYPGFIASAGLYYDYANIDINLFTKYVSSYENTRFAARINGQPPQPQPLGDYFIINMTLGKSLGEKFKTRIFLEIQNLTDERYSTVVGYPDYGRKIILGVSQTFH